MSHAFVSIDTIAECFACGELEGHAEHAGHEPRRNDLIGALCASVKRAGLTMTLYGVPIEEEALREKALDHAVERIADTMARQLVADLELPVFSDG